MSADFRARIFVAAEEGRAVDVIEGRDESFGRWLLRLAGYPVAFVAYVAGRLGRVAVESYRNGGTY